MNGRVAKRIRRGIYGSDMAHGDRTYKEILFEFIRELRGEKVKMIKKIVVNTGLRQRYQAAKKKYYQERRAA